MSSQANEDSKRYQKLADRFEGTRRLQQAILQLACSDRFFSGSLKEAASLATEVVADAIDVEQVSIWFLDQDGKTLNCIDLFQRSVNRHSAGQTLEQSDYPAYFEAIRQGRAVNADDARSDERTCEFRDDYLIPMGITSMLDAGIRTKGAVRGVVCIEHKGTPRKWSDHEIVFAAEVADQLAFSHLWNQKRELQRLLEHSQRLGSLGLLVGGIAHDFNNLLTVISCNIEMAQHDIADKGLDIDTLEDAQAAAERAAILTRKLLAFGQQQILQKERINLTEIVKETVPFLSRIIPENIALTIGRTDDDAWIEADRAQIDQIIMNLCINARDAILEVGADHNGQIAVEVHCHSTSPSSVQLLIEDNGIGLQTSDHERIFTPFFTTKEAATGSGLGLSVIYGIIKQHEARIDVLSAPGAGATFVVTFRHDASEQPERDKQIVPAQRFSDQRRILVLEGDMKIRRLMKRIIKRTNAEVTLAVDVHEASVALEDTSFDLILSDVSLEECPEAITESSQRPPIIYTSAEAFRANRHSESRDSVLFIARPFRPEDLLAAIEKVAPIEIAR